MKKEIDLSRRQILGGLGTIGAASAAAGLGTRAFFSDQETFRDNTITAGSLDLKVDWEEHYSDWSDDEVEGLEQGVRMDRPQDGEEFVGLPDPENPLVFVHRDDLEQFMANTAVEAYPDADDDGIQDDVREFEMCEDGADTPEDLDPSGGLRTENDDTVDEDGNIQPLVSLQDVKPGDFGELTLSFHLCDNPGHVWLQGELVGASENGVTEPETGDSDEEDDVVELLDTVQTLLWYDSDLDNVLDREEEAFFRGSLRELLDAGASDSGIPLDGDLETAFDELNDPPSADDRECFAESETHAIGLAWWIPTDDPANEIQTDSVLFDLGFYAEQCRHNMGAGQDQGRFQSAEGRTVERSLEDVPAPDEPPETPDSPIEGYPVSEEEFEDFKERASNGELPQPPRETLQEEVLDDGENLNTAAQQQQQRTISKGQEFDGWESSEVRSDPPDSNIAVGPEHVVLAVNRRWGIYDKGTGTRGFEAQLEDWWDPVLDDTETFVFDPKALYDHHSNRFVLMAVARDTTEQNGSWVVAVSDDSNPFGTWWITRIPHRDGSTWVDYPGLGVDQNGIYLTANIFNFSNNFQYSKLVSIDKTPLYNGNSFTYWWFNDLRNPDGSRAFTVQPTHGMTRSGTQHLVNSRWNSGNRLTLWKLTDPTSRPRLSRHNVSVSSYSLPPNAEQPDTSNTLDTVDARLMNAVYANGSVWTAHSISYDWNDDGDASAILKWYEIDVSSNSIAQSRGWGRPEADYYFPAIARNPELRSTMIVYNESDSESVFPRIEVAGRTSGHTQNSLEDVQIIKVGESEYDRTRGTDRWGDYAGIVVDPAFTRFWSFSEYAIDPDTSSEWETYVGEAGFSI